jgi:hypothetical protein
VTEPNPVNHVPPDQICRPEDINWRTKVDEALNCIFHLSNKKRPRTYERKSQKAFSAQMRVAIRDAWKDSSGRRLLSNEVAAPIIELTNTLDTLEKIACGQEAFGSPAERAARAILHACYIGQAEGISDPKMKGIFASLSPLRRAANRAKKIIADGFPKSGPRSGVGRNLGFESFVIKFRISCELAGIRLTISRIGGEHRGTLLKALNKLYPFPSKRISTRSKSIS